MLRENITTDKAGVKVSEMRYKPWGEIRYSWTAGLSTTPAYKLSSYTFTGQFSYMDDPTTSGVTEGFGLMFYNARFYDPALGRFTSADTIIPGGVQGYDRYAYVNNNPIRYNDPTGHMCSDPEDPTPECEGANKPGEKSHGGGLGNGGGKGKEQNKEKEGLKIPKLSGNNLEINILAGISLTAEGYDGYPTTVGLLYYSLGLVTDQYGGMQFYYTTMDITYIPGSSDHMGGFMSGPAESADPTSAYGLGVTASRGWILGDHFTTDDFMGEGYSETLGIGPVSGSFVHPYDKNLDYAAIELGGSIGAPVSMGHIATKTTRIGDRISMPQELIPTCRMMGQCGSLFPPLLP